MRKLLVAAVVAVLSLAANAALAVPPEDSGPGPNGSNEHGLCTAYFNGQKNGHEEGNGPGPFGALEDDADDSPEDDDKERNITEEQQPSDDVFEFCLEHDIAGNPDDNGRWDCNNDDGLPRDSDGDGELECIPNG